KWRAEPQNAQQFAARRRTPSGGEPRPQPVVSGFFAAEDHTLMQPRQPAVPELDCERSNAKTRPVRRPRHLADMEARGLERDRLLQRKPAFERARLLRCPG